MKGRKPTPTQLKVIRSTDQPSRINQNELKSSLVQKLPNPPTWFSDIAKKIYRSKGKELINQGVLGTLDLDMFALYCNEYAIYIETSEQLSQVPHNSQLTEASSNVYRRIRQINQQAWERSKSMAIEFGFTPSARSRVSPITGKEQLTEFEKMMKGL